MSISPQLKNRIFGALLYGAFIFITFGWNRFSFLTGVFILMLLGIHEAISIDHLFKASYSGARSKRFWSYLSTLLLSGFILFGTLSLSFQNIVRLLIITGILHHIYLFFAYSRDRLSFYKKLPSWLWIAAYIGLSVGALYSYSIILFEYDKMKVFHVLFCVWVTDIGAYFAGSNFGKTKFAPSISPNKTWEGVFGGIVSALLFSYLYSVLGEFSIKDALWVGTIAAVTTVLGDLSQSGLKRVSGIKDSGQLIPGHGGILDRIDGYLYVQPFVALYYLSI